ncbi:MAG: META domain-containing protein [Calditrichaeota bacterium]|nr:META domain-containing protein [Calditrichota bacterium]MCB0307147.1 META domain-containing protein [Calditrichota bacterium]MCB0312223.1 META domain-containing protein [Calditrichota bacterium]
MKMMKNLMLLIAAMLLLLAGCSESTAPEVSYDLQNTQWRLRSILEGGAYLVVPGNELHTLEFSDSLTFQGKSDCQDYGGHYVVRDPNGIGVLDVYSTLNLCADGSLNPQYLNALAHARAYQVGEERLFIYYNTGDDLLIFQPK